MDQSHEKRNPKKKEFLELRFSMFSKLRSTIQKQTLLTVLIRIFCKKFVPYLFSMFSRLRLTIQKKTINVFITYL
jgi:hypothetical protein